MYLFAFFPAIKNIRQLMYQDTTVSILTGLVLLRNERIKRYGKCVYLLFETFFGVFNDTLRVNLT